MVESVKMKSEILKNDAINLSIKSLDKPPEKWETFNDKLNTKIIYDNAYSKKEINLFPGELPILECVLEQSYLLITTDRIISIIENIQKSILIDKIDKFSNDYENQNYKLVNAKYPKIHKILIKTIDGNELLFFIDSYYPSTFAKTLIYNLLSYKKFGYWYVNPR